MDEIEREALRLCRQLRTKLAELNALFEKRAQEIERSSPIKMVKRQPLRKNIYVSMEANANSTND